ncbi:hypothetical protein FAM21834_00375 [Lentilactobacillus parabuchneri]|uniref:Uncharacterized protein n=1 Tax=Lentilactobacillus parabuchneri TaxID=152331 RepID=A0A1X1FHM7_9LACO|nr:hypothetical protein [Lentilactobacillus parabuchneri]APR06644.1 hypothetical protein FAM21731_00429 [Lentilactobacillus parabuchneri]KRN75855.1 hypothetical protein IV42_GL000331 [Lentilactobacillus parabuchneri]MBW0223704.1 hypothetical protein [Lentilactobacillus parabuchneri]MBW0246771.1 hypothetical protein [Lentilactobacillus parabuchneri]MBW0264765.1 hypothetical protein [Lentilactobacillus parabuchneri]
MQFNSSYAKLAIKQIEIAFQHGEIRMRPGNNEYELHSKKTETYFRQHGITFQKALADSVEALTTSKDVKFRGPSKSYFPGQPDGVIFDFLVPLYDSSMYIKFSFIVRHGRQFIVFESFHESDKPGLNNFMDLY